VVSVGLRLIGVISVALLLGVSVVRGDAGDAPTGGVCDVWSKASAVALHGTIDAVYLHGRFDELLDLRSGRFVRHVNFTRLRESTGSDGTSAWRKDWSGTVHRYDSRHARAIAVSDEWFERRGWCAPDRLGARLTPAARRLRSGRAFNVVQARPRGGVPVEVWSDAASGLPDRTIVRLNEDTRVPRFSDWRSCRDLRSVRSISRRRRHRTTFA